MFCGKTLPMAAIIMEIKFDFFFIFKQERIRSLAKRSVHSLWLAFSFQFWLKGPWKYVSQIMTKKGWGRESEGNGKKVLAAVIAYFWISHLLQQTACRTGLCHHGALPFLAVLPLVSNPAFLCRAGGSGATACLWRWYLSLAWTCVPVPLCQLSSLVSACFLWKHGTLLQPRWTKCMDRK